MALAWRATGTAKKVASGDLSGILLPTGHAQNDILVAQFLSQDNVAATMSGWTLKGSLITSGANSQVGIWWKRDNGAESNPTITHTAGGIAMCQIHAFSGVDPTLADPWRDFQSTTGSTSGPGAVTVTGPALTGVISGDMRLYMGGWNANDTSGAITGNWAVVSGWTERQEAGQVGTTWSDSFVLDTLLATGSAASVSTDGNGNLITGPLAWVGIQAALSSDTAASGALIPMRVPNRRVGPMALRYRFRQPVVLSPFIPSSVTFTDSGSGTITLSGTDSESQSHTSSLSGTITLSGSKSESASFADSRAGTITLSGSSTQSHSHTGTGTVTITLSGTASESYVPPGGVSTPVRTLMGVGQ